MVTVPPHPSVPSAQYLHSHVGDEEEVGLTLDLNGEKPENVCVGSFGNLHMCVWCMYVSIQEIKIILI